MNVVIVVAGHIRWEPLGSAREFTQALTQRLRLAVLLGDNGYLDRDAVGEADVVVEYNDPILNGSRICHVCVTSTTNDYIRLLCLMCHETHGRRDHRKCT